MIIASIMIANRVLAKSKKPITGGGGLFGVGVFSNIVPTNKAKPKSMIPMPIRDRLVPAII
jgi:hypothetical protein